jgi:sugar phosphate isomerase/epimerase
MQSTHIPHASQPPVYISSLHFPWCSVEEACDFCAHGLSLDGIEFSIREEKAGRHLTSVDCDRVGQAALEHGLSVSAHVWEDLPAMGRSEACECLRRHLANMVRIGACHLVVHGGSHEVKREGIRLTAGILQEVAAAYEDAGVVICLENHYAYDYHDSHELFSTPEEYLELFAALDSRAVRACLDYGHSHMNGNTEAMLRQLAPYLAYVHIADNGGVDDDHLAFGEGTIDWKATFEATREVGFAGPFTIEFPVKDASDASLQHCLELLGKTFGGRTQRDE